MIERLLNELEGVRRAGQGYIARCPSHKDRSPSLSINPGDRGWLVYCHAGCTTKDVLATTGLRLTHLFYDHNGTDSSDTGDADMRHLIRQVRPRDLWAIERFDDVGGRVLLSPGVATERSMALANVHYWDLVSLPFPEAMKYWVVLRDGWLWDAIGENWQGRQPGPDWWATRDYTATKLWDVWLSRPVVV